MIDFAIDNYLRISWQDVLLVCISSLIIVLVCKKFFWSKLLDWVDRRQKAIQDNIDESVRLKDEAMEVKNKYDEQMRQAGAKADEILSSARAQADLEKEKILDNAKNQAANIERAAYEDIEREKLEASKEMKAAITDTAIAAAGAILQQEVDADKQQEIVDQFIEQAGNGAW